MVAIGIDLGTVCSCVAVWRNDSVEVITNEYGNRITPSYVAFTPKERLIGEPAKNQASLNVVNTIFGTKRLIGRSFDDIGLQMDMRHFPFQIVNVSGKPKIVVRYKNKKMLLSPEEISAMVIFRMKECAEKFLGCKVSDAVVTVPAYFNDAQRQATKLTGTIAGLNIIKIINEPTAASLAYGLSNNLKGERNVLIYDLGGSTFDVSIMKIRNGMYEVKATAGNSRLGGEDFDNRIVAYFVEDFLKRYGKEVKSRRALRRLRSAAEIAKKSLTSAVEAIVEIESLKDGIDYKGSISRVLFEQLCSDLFTDTLQCVEKALVDVGMSKKDVHDILLVGGSTRIPEIRKMLRDYFGEVKIICSINPEEAIACGAAVQAAILTGVKSVKIKDLVLVDVVPLSLGIETVRGAMFKVVERNTPIPCRLVREITTLEDYQTIMTIEVFEGERPLTRHNRLLGVFELRNIPPAPRGIPKIDIIFDVDVNGILTVSAKDKSTGNCEMITIKKNNKLTQKEINKMIADAEKFRDEDYENKSRLESRNQLETYIYNVKQSVVENLEKLNAEECAKMLGECKEAIAWLDDNPDCMQEEYDRKMSELFRRWSLKIRQLDHGNLEIFKLQRKDSSRRSKFGEQTASIKEVDEENFGCLELFQGGQHRQHAAMLVMAMLGFYFEVSRHDRDKYIRVHNRHIRPDKLHHFERIRSDATLPLDYDYMSATHPAWQFWRRIGKKGISSVATYKDFDPDGSTMRSLGQNQKLLSDTDIIKINSVYGVKCFENPRHQKIHDNEE